MGKRGVRGGMGGYLKQDDEREASPRLELELRTGQSWILGWFVILYLGYHCTLTVGINKFILIISNVAL